MNCKRKDLTLKEKINVLEYAKANKCTQLELAKKFQISQAQVSKLLKNKEKILNAMKCNANPNLKRQRSGKEATVEEALLRWFNEVQALGVPINGIILSKKAADIAQELNISNFKATNGWLCRWKKRNQISFKKNPVEIYDAAVEMMDESCNDISTYSPYIAKNYFTKCTFSINSTNDEVMKSDKESSSENATGESCPKFSDFDSDSEANSQISSCELIKQEVQDDEDNENPSETCSPNKTPSPLEVTNACNVIRRFLEAKPNINFDLFYKLENQVANLLKGEKKSKLRCSPSKKLVSID